MINPLLLVYLPGTVALVGVLPTPLVLWGVRRLRSRARARNRHGRCGACGHSFPFSAAPDEFVVAGGIFLCRNCAQRWRRRVAWSFATIPVLLGGLALSALSGVLQSHLGPGYWLGDRLIPVLWPTIGTGSAWWLAVRAARRANLDPQLPAYDSVVQALDEIRARRDVTALPGA
jgi:hypothetical protein